MVAMNWQTIPWAGLCHGHSCCARPLNQRGAEQRMYVLAELSVELTSSSAAFSFGSDGKLNGDWSV